MIGNLLRLTSLVIALAKHLDADPQVHQLIDELRALIAAIVAAPPSPPAAG